MSRWHFYVAASGPKSMVLAGKIGDGLISFTEQVSQPELRQAFEQGARATLKQPTSMPILVAHSVVVGDRQEAERWAPLLRHSPRVASYLNDPDPRSIQRRAEQDVPLEQVYSTWVVSEDPQAHLQALEKLIDGDVTHIFCIPRSKIRPKSSNFMASRSCLGCHRLHGREPPIRNRFSTSPLPLADFMPEL